MKWHCFDCGHRNTYHGPGIDKCKGCGGSINVPSVNTSPTFADILDEMSPILLTAATVNKNAAVWTHVGSVGIHWS